MHTHTQRESQ